MKLGPAEDRSKIDPLIVVMNDLINRPLQALVFQLGQEFVDPLSNCRILFLLEPQRTLVRHSQRNTNWIAGPCCVLLRKEFCRQ
ncbi:MAG: hypothetical protein NT154_22205 [Verrucomicrobia bacterium]|nr:hypothetical protein [Verrucomicrobiota bacterium]